MDRIKTGVPGFDELVEGGIPAGFNTLVIGHPGAGKTIFGLQYLVDGALSGENGVYVSLDSTNDVVKSQARQFGWDVDALEKDGKLLFLKISLNRSKIYLFDIISTAIRSIKAKRLVFDSLADFATNIDQFVIPMDYGTQEGVNSVVGLSSKGEAEEEELPSSLVTSSSNARAYYKGKSERRISYFAINEFSNFGTTNLLITEEQMTGEQSSIDGVSEYLCDGVIRMGIDRIAKEAVRSLTIQKMRNTNHRLESMVFKITPKGIVLKGDTVFQGSKVSGIT